MFAVIAQLRVDPADGEALEQLFGEMAAHVRAHEPGTCVYHLARNGAAPGRYTVIEIYANEEALEAHLTSATFQACRPKVGALFREPPEVSRVDVVI